MLANGFGAVGYFAATLEWLWAILVIGYPFLTQARLVRPDPEASAEIPQFAISLPTELSIGITIVVTIVMALITVACLILMPKALSSGTKKVTQTAADSLIPVVTQHQPISKKRRRILTIKTRLLLKALLVLLPFFAIHLAPHNSPLPYTVVSTIAWFTLIATAACFGLQYMVARLLKLDFSRLN